MGRFTQPDSIIPNFTNPQTWNRYSYVDNNPIGYNDPTGHCAACLPIVIGIGLVVLVSAVIYVASESRVAPSVDNLTVYPTNTLREPGAPVRNTPTPTINPTISSFQTASPTGTLPNVQFPTITSTATRIWVSATALPPIQPEKMPGIALQHAKDIYGAIEEGCSVGVPCGDAFPQGSTSKRWYDIWEIISNGKDFIKDLDINNIQFNNPYSPPKSPKSTGTPPVIPVPARTPTIKKNTPY